jgi:hypothetical protein
MTVPNADVARIFNRLADLLEIEGANPFRVRAYRDAAHTVGDLAHEVSALLAAGRHLSELHGIGKDLAGKIKEIVETGHLGPLEETERRVPEGLLELLTLGPLAARRGRLRLRTGAARLAAPPVYPRAAKPVARSSTGVAEALVQAAATALKAGTIGGLLRGA